MGLELNTRKCIIWVCFCTFPRLWVYGRKSCYDFHFTSTLKALVCACIWFWTYSKAVVRVWSSLRQFEGTEPSLGGQREWSSGFYLCWLKEMRLALEWPHFSQPWGISLATSRGCTTLLSVACLPSRHLICSGPDRLLCTCFDPSSCTVKNRLHGSRMHLARQGAGEKERGAAFWVFTEAVSSNLAFIHLSISSRCGLISSGTAGQ